MTNAIMLQEKLKLSQIVLQLSKVINTIKHHFSYLQDALRVMHRLMQQVDNSIALGQLSECDLSIELDGIVRRDLFFVYTTQAKKHVHEMMVMLHRSHVVFARPKRTKGSENIVYEFTNSMEVRHLLYTQRTYVIKGLSSCGSCVAL